MSSKTEKVAPPTGIKVSELAKEVGMKSTLVLEKAKELGMAVKSHSSLLNAGQADRLRAKLGGGKKLKAELESKTAISRKKKADEDGAVAEAEAPEAIEAESSPAE